MSYKTNKAWLGHLQQRIPQPTACTDGLDCPQDRLWEWAQKSIFDRGYDHRGPAWHWRFNLLSHSGTRMVVSPVYEPRSVGLEREAKQREESPDARTVEKCAKVHAARHGTSNWEMTQYFLLRVVTASEDRRRRNSAAGILGYLSGESHLCCCAYLPARVPEVSELARDVLSSLQAAVQGDPRAFVGADHCGFCNRKLTDAFSAARGYGPDCAERYGLPKIRVAPPGEAPLPASVEEGHA